MNKEKLQEEITNLENVKIEKKNHDDKSKY